MILKWRFDPLRGSCTAVHRCLIAMKAMMKWTLDAPMNYEPKVEAKRRETRGPKPRDTWVMDRIDHANGSRFVERSGRGTGK